MVHTLGHDRSVRAQQTTNCLRTNTREPAPSHALGVCKYRRYRSSQYALHRSPLNHACILAYPRRNSDIYRLFPLAQVTFRCGLTVRALVTSLRLLISSDARSAKIVCLPLASGLLHCLQSIGKCHPCSGVPNRVTVASMGSSGDFQFPDHPKLEQVLDTVTLDKFHRLRPWHGHTQPWLAPPSST